MKYAHLLFVASLLSSAGTACMAQNWQGLPFMLPTDNGYGPQGTVYDLKTWDPDGNGSLPPVLVIAGSFTTVLQPDGTPLRANNICTWDGCSYALLCDTSQALDVRGFNSLVYSLEVLNGTLYAGGLFTAADGSAAAAVAQWGGSSWGQTGGGVWEGTEAGRVEALHVHNDGTTTKLVVGGVFDTAGGSAHYSLAGWSGSAWSTIGGAYKCGPEGETQVPGIVTSIASDGSDLLIGGDFWGAGLIFAADAAWQTSSGWVTTTQCLGLGEDVKIPPCLTPSCSGARTQLNAVGAYDSYSWAGGGQASYRLSFDNCNAPSNPPEPTGLVRSQRTTWSDGSGVGAGPDMVPSSEFEAINSVFYAAGDKRLYPPSGSSQTYVHNVCSWTGSAWSGVADFLTGEVRAIELYNGEIYIAGGFGGASVTADGTTRLLPCGFARLTLQCNPADVGAQGGSTIPDGVIDNNDYQVYIDYFYGGCAAADLGVQGGEIGRDGQFNANDWQVFFDYYFGGCP